LSELLIGDFVVSNFTLKFSGLPETELIIAARIRGPFLLYKNSSYLQAVIPYKGVFFESKYNPLYYVDTLFFLMLPVLISVRG
jgi:hypothetical protein